ncbi:LDCC motif putative metal-binding protein [Thermoclostridium caenicola]|uniref:LDCC motif putative metal-binding protein n=1 Tax=Thermoclostridium caenicola TaxID=659425 RepID=UPI00242B0DE5|nr:LDCC motif putative metal-binding protein [Thermoclostridium caenicola]
MLKHIKKAISVFLERLAKENEKAFGKAPLDCCRLNRSPATATAKRQTPGEP